MTATAPPNSARRNRHGPPSGLGIGWRPELATFIADRTDLSFVEVIVEALPARGPLPAGLDRLAGCGVPVVPHGVGLGLGGAEPLQAWRIARLAAVAERLQAPLVSEHVAVVRAGGLEAGHLLAVPRTRDALDVLIANVRTVSAELSVPLALEHPAAPLHWPDADFSEAEFLTEIAERTGALLLLDLANLHADRVNHGVDPGRFLDRLPWERVAYIHVAGGVMRGGLYHDTHVHPVTGAVLELVREVARRYPGPHAFMLERDGHYPSVRELGGELAAISAAAAAGGAGHPGLPGAGPVTDAMPRLRTPRGGSGADGGDGGDGGRARLRQTQTELVRALVADGPIPAGFDPRRVAATRTALLHKRADAVARAWPALSCLPGFRSRFTAFAAGRAPVGAYADGMAFARAVRADLDEPARSEQLMAAVARRRLAVAVDRQAGARPLVAIRAPFVGTRLLGSGRTRLGRTRLRRPGTE